MQLEMYQQETIKVAQKHEQILNEIHQKFEVKNELSSIEEQALLHSIQVITENAIGKARHWLKANNDSTTVSAYDVFEALKAIDVIGLEELNQWKKVIGLRNAIVHEYMKIDIELVLTVVKNKQYEFILQFLNRPFS